MKNGIQILVHFGLDSVTLKGKGFAVLKKQLKTVRAKTPIINLDKTKKIERIKETVMNIDEILKIYL